MVRNQVCKRRHSRSIDFLAVIRRLYCVFSNNVQDVNHISKNLERFEVKNNCVHFFCNRCVYIPWEHQSFIENSDHRNIFADLQAEQNRIIIPLLSLKLISVLKWWIAFFSVFIFCFTFVHFKSESQLCEVSWKTGPGIEVLLHSLTCSICKINQQGKSCTMPVGVKPWLWQVCRELLVPELLTF